MQMHECADSVNGSRITRKRAGMIRDTHLRDSRAEKGSSSTYYVVADAEVSCLFSSFVGEFILINGIKRHSFKSLQKVC